jgi:VanZ family protein
LKFLSLWGPVLLITGLIFFLSSMSDPGAPPDGLSDTAAHFLVYAGLGCTLVRALAGGRSERMTAGRIAIAAALVAVYGFSDEVHQAFVPGRTPDLNDLLADAAGGITGAALFAIAAKGVRWLRRPA